MQETQQSRGDWQQIRRASRQAAEHRIPAEEWVPTGRAIRATGLSRSTLHRWVAEGLVQEGLEYRNGLTLRSPRRWNVQRLEGRITLLRSLPKQPERTLPDAPPACGTGAQEDEVVEIDLLKPLD